MKRRALIQGAVAVVAANSAAAASAKVTNGASPEMTDLVRRYYDAWNNQRALWDAVDRGEAPEALEDPANDLVWETRNAVMAMPARSLSDYAQKACVYLHHTNGKMGVSETEPDTIYLKWSEVEALLGEVEQIAGEVSS